MNQYSRGLCTNETYCVSTARTASMPHSFKMSTDLAKRICQNYIDSYMQKLSRTKFQRTAEYNNTIMMVHDACVFDVAITGEADVSDAYSD